MNSGALQYAIVAVCVAISAYYAFGLFAPRLRARVMSGVGAWLRRSSHPQWMRVLGGRLTPSPQASGCGSGCSACDGCGTKVQRPATVQPPQSLRAQQNDRQR